MIAHSFPCPPPDDEPPPADTQTHPQTHPQRGGDVKNKAQAYANADNANPLLNDNWTGNLPSTDHVRFFRSVDWSSSLLGSVTEWTTALRLHVFTLFADSRPSCIYWGPSKVAIYNEQFVPLAAQTHPRLMGYTFQEAFPELWGTIKHVFAKAGNSGFAADVNEQQLFVERNGLVEETYFSGNFNPLRGDTGQIEGFYNSVHEVTKLKLTERRTAMLKSLSAPPILQQTSFANRVLPILETSPFDIPMALLYQVDKESVPGRCVLHLLGSIGAPKGHAIAVEKAEITSHVGLMPFFRKARATGATTNLVDDSFTGIQWLGFEEPPKVFSIIPITENDNLFGFLAMGTNPRRPIDDDHHQFIRDISIRMNIIAASLVSAEESRKRNERLERELKSDERQIRFFAEHASVGMQNLSVDGITVWANEQFYEITGLAPQIEATEHKISFIDMVLEEDVEKARKSWTRLISGEPNVSVELRLKRMVTPPSGEPEPACILSLSFPYMENGKAKSIMTCITDVSRLKWAESFEARQAQEAREAKRQTEDFIDSVSHEMRNPLSAIFQCAEMIQSSIASCQEIGFVNENMLEVLRNNEDAAKTISICAKHQKRIVDDVLTVSKLNYTMLSFTPEPIQLGPLVEETVKMFDHSPHDMKITTVLEPSLKHSGIDWVQCDPTRLTQILVNLITNAVKFTTGEPKREVIIRYGSTLSEPRKTFPQNITWAPNHNEMKELTLDPEWGSGEHVYLCVQVSDTGVGMTKDEIKKLFSRFEQAGSRTSIKYGGSGLGLFISHRLTEKQNGEIGVASTPNQGSTFAFYVKARRAESKIGAVPQKILPQVSIRSQSNSRVSKASSIPNGIVASQMHVLLVEDNLVNQKILLKQLTKSGCVVHIANHGVEALSFLRQTELWGEPPVESKRLDIILMDWEMPVMDGLTCSREIRALQKSGKVTRHVEIIATTANARDEQIQSALASGVDCVMSKPFVVSDLLAKMQERLARIGGDRAKSKSLD